MAPRRENGDQLHVTIVSDNVETLDGLEAYFRRAGVTVRSTRDIERASRLIALSPAALVLFPDDFTTDAVIAAFSRLRSDKPRALLVLITGEPKRFEKLSRLHRVGALILPKPAWSWTILDAIRHRANG